MLLSAIALAATKGEKKDEEEMKEEKKEEEEGEMGSGRRKCIRRRKS